MKKFIPVIALTAACLFACGEQQTSTQPENQPSGNGGAPVSMTVSELLAHPVLNRDIEVTGTVDKFGEFLSGCFYLKDDSTGEYFEVYYRNLSDGTTGEWEPAAIEGIANGDRVAVTGRLRSATGSLPSRTIWARSILKLDTAGTVR